MRADQNAMEHRLSANHTNPLPEVASETWSASVAPLYLLAVGLLIGLALSPFVLGRFWPQQYEQLFPAQEAQQVLDDFDAAYAQRFAKAMTAGATETDDLEVQYQVGRAKLTEAVSAARAMPLSDLRHAVMLAMFAVFFMEGVLGATGPCGQRLAIMRGALMAIWLALLIACPYPFKTISLWLVLALIVAAVLFGLTPTPRRRRS